MRHETAEVASDATRVLTDAKPGGFVIHHPDAEHGTIVSRRQQYVDMDFACGWWAYAKAWLFSEIKSSQ